MNLLGVAAIYKGKKFQLNESWRGAAVDFQCHVYPHDPYNKIVNKAFEKAPLLTADESKAVIPATFKQSYFEVFEELPVINSASYPLRNRSGGSSSSNNDPNQLENDARQRIVTSRQQGYESALAKEVQKARTQQQAISALLLSSEVVSDGVLNFLKGKDAFTAARDNYNFPQLAFWIKEACAHDQVNAVQEARDDLQRVKQKLPPCNGDFIAFVAAFESRVQTLKAVGADTTVGRESQDLYRWFINGVDQSYFEVDLVALRKPAKMANDKYTAARDVLLEFHTSKLHSQKAAAECDAQLELLGGDKSSKQPSKDRTVNFTELPNGEGTGRNNAREGDQDTFGGHAGRGASGRGTHGQGGGRGQGGAGRGQGGAGRGQGRGGRGQGGQGGKTTKNQDYHDCRNCGKSHSGRCFSEIYTCTVCKKDGHMEKFCNKLKAMLKESDAQESQGKGKSFKGGKRKAVESDEEDEADDESEREQHRRPAKSKRAQTKFRLGKNEVHLTAANDWDSADDAQEAADGAYRQVHMTAVQTGVYEEDDEGLVYTPYAKVTNAEPERQVHVTQLQRESVFKSAAVSPGRPGKYVQLDSFANVAVLFTDDALPMTNIINVKSSVSGLSGDVISGREGTIAGNFGTALIGKQYPHELVPAGYFTKLGFTVALEPDGVKILNCDGKVLLRGEVHPKDKHFHRIKKDSLMAFIKEHVVGEQRNPASKAVLNTYRKQPVRTKAIEPVPDIAYTAPGKRLTTVTPRIKKQVDQVQRMRDVMCPSDVALQIGLGNGCYPKASCVAENVSIAQQVHGPSMVRHLVSMRKPSYKVSTNNPALCVGERVHGDHIIADNKGDYIILVDSKSGFLIVELAPGGKSAASVSEINERVTRQYNARGHKMARIVWDSEATLLATKDASLARETDTTGTPPGQHNQLVERIKQDFDDKVDHLRLSLPYKYDPKLHFWLHHDVMMSAVDFLNHIVRARTTPVTPWIVFHEAKPQWDPEDLLPVGTIVQVLDLNTGKPQHAVISRNNLARSGSYWVYDPFTRRKSLDRNVVTLLSLKHQKQLAQQFGFAPQSTLNLRYSNTEHLRVTERMEAAMTQQSTVEPSPAISPAEASSETVPVPTLAVTSPEDAPASVPAVPSEGVDVPLGDPPSESVRVSTPTLTSEDVSVSVPPAVSAPVVPVTPLVDIPAAPSASASASASEGENATRQPTAELAAQAMARLQLARMMEQSKGQKTPQDAMQRMVLVAYHEEVRLKCREYQVNVTKKNQESGSAVLKRFMAGTPEMQRAAKLAIGLEAKAHLERDLGDAVDPASMSNDDYYHALRTMVLLKEKFYPDGEFEKLKARLVVLGNFMKEGTYGSTYAPTVDHDTVMFILSVSAACKAEINVWDVPSAFTNTPIKPGATKRPTWVTISDPFYVAEWIKHRPQDKKLLTTKGHLIIELSHYLYGMKDAPARFHEYLQSILEKAGFFAIISDTCLVYKYDDEDWFFAGGHVDDLLGSNPHDGAGKFRDEFEQALTSVFGPMERKPLVKGNYLGMAVQYTREEGKLVIHQPKHIRKMHDSRPHINWEGKKYTSPGEGDFFKGVIKDSTPVNITEYLSLLQEMRYIAERTRRDIIIFLNELATASQRPTKTDMAKLHRVAIYLWQSRRLVLELQPKDLTLEVYADASYALHKDGHSHTGLVFLLGGAPFMCKSRKQKILATASTQAEYDALTTGTKYVEWYTGQYRELDLPLKLPINVFQDNKSTIHLATTPGSYKNSKHNLIRYAYVKHHHKLGTIKINYCPTDEMIADGLTKALTGAAFLKSRTALGVVEP
jgi:hypothetical protein